MLEFNGKEKDYTNGEYGPKVCTDFICDFIEENKKKPFLVYFPMILTHCPFDPTPDSSAIGIPSLNWMIVTPRWELSGSSQFVW